MEKIYTALGLMSGTSLDGIDLSVIDSDGESEFSLILDKYFKYDDHLVKKLLLIRDKISNSNDIVRYKDQLDEIERDFTLFNAKIINETLNSMSKNVDVIGFHGQTIYHNPSEKMSIQIGDGNLLSQLTKKKVVFNFRQNDLNNGGQGAPLTPIFHNMLANKVMRDFNQKFPINIINIGGIANITITVEQKKLWKSKDMSAFDIGPGNCLIDKWIRKNSKKKYDEKGLLAKSGQTDELILNQALENFSNQTFSYENSLDVSDFDIFFAKGLSIENGASTITDFTAKLISEGIDYVHSKYSLKNSEWLVCGGGRKNEYLIEKIQSHLKNINLKVSEKYNVNGDFVESQAFAYLAIRSIEKKPISFPSTTRCKKFLTGGIVIKNF